MTQLRVGITNDFAPGNLAGDPMETAVAEHLTPLAGLEWEYLPKPTHVISPADVEGYDAIVSGEPTWTADSMRSLKRLALIAYWGIGVDRIDLRAATEADVLVTNSPHPANHSSVAETILTFILALSKHLPAKDRLTREGRALDAQQLSGRIVQDQVIGTIGLGATARKLIEFVRPLRPARVLSFDPYVEPRVAHGLGVELVELPTVMREADFVAVMCTLTDETRGLVGDPELRLMKPTAYLLNAARGPIVDEAALVRALRDGRLAGAGLDVFEREPPARDEPILAFENVIATGHAMAWTAESLYGACEEPCRAVTSLFRGELPAHVVNRDVLNRLRFHEKLARLAQAARA
jgi:phosphoglycerate dehydrogenase-like enzyme